MGIIITERERGVNAVPLKNGESDACGWLEASGIRIHTGHNEAIVRGAKTELTELEYKILLLLISHPHKIFSVKNLYESVWDEPFIYTSGNTVMVHVRRLRKKIEENPQSPQIIENVWGKGYRLGT